MRRRVDAAGTGRFHAEDGRGNAEDAWPVWHRGEVPAFDPATWRLRVWGQVQRTLEWSWDEFVALPSGQRNVDLDCPTKGFTLAGNAWTGVATREVLSRVSPLGEASWVIAHGHGDFRAGFSLTAFAGPDAILATGRNGDPLSPEHGAPVRLVVPGENFCKSVKWLTGLEFLNKPWPDEV